MLKFTPKEVCLKNGKTVLIRQAELIDADDLLQCVKNYIPTSNYVPKLEHEIKLSVAQEVEWIHSFLKNENSLLLVAEYESQIIGNIDLAGSQRKIMEHTAVIGMGMLEKFRNSGLGTFLLSAVIDWAQQNSILEIIWLQVYTENKVGLNLYRKLGFVENGIIKNFFKKDNQYFDNLTMSMNVKN